MGSTIKVDSLADEIAKTLKEFQGATSNAVEDAVFQVAKETSVMLRGSSPKQSGKYAKGWSYTKDRRGYKGDQHISIVHQKGKGYRLTHLLEKGHAIVRGGRKVGTSPAIPHLAQAEEFAARELESRIKSNIERKVM